MISNSIKQSFFSLCSRMRLRCIRFKSYLFGSLLILPNSSAMVCMPWSSINFRTQLTARQKIDKVE